MSLTYVKNSRAYGTDLATLSLTSTNVGNLLVLQAAIGGGSAPSITSISGGGVSGWTKVQSHDPSSGNYGRLDMWIGTVASAGSQTITLNYSAAVGGHIVDIAVHELSAGDASAVWSVDSSGQGGSTTNTTPVDYPSLTSPSSGACLYFGCAYYNGVITETADPGAIGDAATYGGSTWYYNAYGYIVNCTASTVEQPMQDLSSANTWCTVGAIIVKTDSPAGSMTVTNQTTDDYWLGPLHLPGGIGQTLDVDDTSDTSLYRNDDDVAERVNALYAAGKITVSGAATPFPRPVGTPLVLHGMGTPEGKVFAPQGSMYLRIDSVGIYLKSSGRDLATGWQLQ